MNKILIFILAIPLFFLKSSPCRATLSSDYINKSKKGVVSIQGRAMNSAYNSTGAWSGTGFLVNKEKGIILTNNHVIGTATTSTFEVTFADGSEAEATILYTDPLLDFGFLKVNSKNIPKSVIALPLGKEEVQPNQDVFMIGKNEGQNFSINVGRITSIYENVGHFPTQSYRISLNAQGGASGSPVINLQGNVIALTHSSNLSSSAFALSINYVIDALQHLEKDKKPPRRFTGALVTYHSLDRASKFNNFDKNLIEKFMTDYPEALNKGLMVDRIFENTPAQRTLQLGDIIWKANGKEVGPSIYEYDKALNESEEVIFTLYRQGKQKEIKVKTYDLHQNVIRKMAEFGGAVFYEADHFTRLLAGAPYGALFITNIKPGSSFFDKFPPIRGTDKVFINVTKLNGIEVKNLEDIVKLIPALKNKENFTVIYSNFAFYSGHNEIPIFSTHNTMAEINYNELDGSPQQFDFHEKEGKWIKKDIASSP